MQCPVCGERLREVEKYGVQVDICPGCKGVWLDRGELEKVLDMADNGGRPMAAATEQQRSVEPTQPRREERPAYRDDDRRHDDRGYDQHKRRKRGGWLGDLLEGFGDD